MVAQPASSSSRSWCARPRRGADCGADLADERALAEKYAPIVRVVEQEDVCGYGEPFVPTDIDLLLGEETVALRGPWNVTDLVEIGPSADDLVDRFEYHLDFPGNALDPGCDYNRWAQRLTEGSEPVVYAHVVGEAGAREARAPVLVLLPVQRLQQHARGRLGDDPARLRRARRRARRSATPVEVGYSSHEGAERAAWDDEKLESSTGGPSSTRRPAPTPTSTRTRSGSGARPRPVSAATTRAARTASSPRAS